MMQSAKLEKQLKANGFVQRGTPAQGSLWAWPAEGQTLVSVVVYHVKQKQSQSTKSVETAIRKAKRLQEVKP